MITGITLPMMAFAAIGASNPAACRQTVDDAIRLACYDAAIDAMTSTGNVRAATKSPEVLPTPAVPAVSPEEIFGKTDATESAIPRNVEAIESTVTEARKAANRRYVLVLANGQTWAQTDDTVLPLAAGAAVRIHRGAMGSFLLGSGTMKKTMRVKRID